MRRVFAFVACLSTTTAFAQDVRITPEVASRSIQLDGQHIVIERIQDPSHLLAADYTRTSRACPPFCIHPIEIAGGVETLGELEVMDFLEDKVSSGKGLLIDSRMPDDFATGSIPGAVNVPFTTLEPNNPYRDQIIEALGARRESGTWDFSGAFELALFCDGPWCDQSPKSIGNLMAAGYPPEKIHYYRGGMQLWLLFGLTLQPPALNVARK